jgi:glycosyltransferase involved in cell wall biosynthesis
MLNLDENAVCMVVYNKYPADTRVKRAAETLRAKGFRVIVVCTSEKGRPDVDECNGVLIQRVRVRKQSGAKLRNALAMVSFILGAFLQVNRIHRSSCPGHYHVHSLPDFLVFVAIWPKMRGARVILDLHESFPEIVLARFRRGAGFISRIAAFLERVSCKFSDHVIVVNETIKKLVIARGESAGRISVIMNSPMAFAVSRTKSSLHPEVARAKRGGTPVFVYAGGINAERDLFTLVNATRLLKEKAVALKILLFTHTQTPFLTSLLEHVEKSGLSNQVLFCGSLSPEDVMTNVSASDVGIVSYQQSPLTEVALPNKVFEYIEAGCPIVSADLATLKDLLGDNAFYYRSQNAESLSSAIIRALHDNQKIQKREALQVKYAECRWEVMQSRLAGIYHQD